MNYSNIIYYDTGNARGLSTVLFVSGCSHHCYHCHNPETWDRHNGKQFDNTIKNQIIKSLELPYIKNFVISGGDPLESYNAPILCDLIQSIKENENKKHLLPVTIILYTGYNIQNDFFDNLNICASAASLIYMCDYIIDGLYIESQSTKQLDFRGSINQKCYKWENNHLIEFEDYFKYRS